MLQNASDFLQGACKKLHLLVERIDIKDVPKTEDKVAEWLQERYLQKDKYVISLRRRSFMIGHCSSHSVVFTCFITLSNVSFQNSAKVLRTGLKYRCSIVRQWQG